MAGGLLASGLLDSGLIASGLLGRWPFDQVAFWVGGLMYGWPFGPSLYGQWSIGGGLMTRIPMVKTE